MLAQPEIKRIPWKRPPLYPKQEAAIFCPERFAFIEAGTKCFAAGTLVKTISGHKPIEQIKVGEYVLSWSGEFYEYKQVLRCLRHCADDAYHAMVKITTKHGEIIVTRNHKFRQGRKWIRADQLARRAVATRARGQRKILRKQSWKAIIHSSWWEGPHRIITPCSRWLWLLANSIFHQRKIQNDKSSSGHCTDLDCLRTDDVQADGESQEFYQDGQPSGKPGNPFHQGKYFTFRAGKALWKIIREHQRKLRTHRRFSPKDTGRIFSLRGFAARFGKKIQSQPGNNTAYPMETGVEARCLTLNEITGFEFFESSEAVYNLTVEDNNNYCITEQNISVKNCGKTVGTMAWFLEQALTIGALGREFWWIAPVYPQTRIAYKRFKRYLPKGTFAWNDSDLWIKLPNGALLVFKSGEKPDNLYGEDVYAAVVDEASRVRPDAWDALLSTLTATNGKVRCIGNVKGRQNWFYKMCRRAEGGDQDMHYAKIIAKDAVEAGVIRQSAIDDAQRTMSEQRFKELYFCEPSDDGGNPFGLDSIVKCLGPLSTDAPYVWGIDLAKSLDWTVCIALDRKQRVCRFERWQKIPWGETKRRIVALVGRTKAYVDSTGVGDPIVEDLQTMVRGANNFEGFKFTSQSKQMIMEGLAAAIQNQEITFPDGIIRMELETFEYEMTRTAVRYMAPEGLHDDCVCALALAVYNKNPVNSLFTYSK